MSDDERVQPPVPVWPRPHPQIHNCSSESPDLQDSNFLKPSGVDAVGSDGPGTLHDVGEEGRTIGLEVRTGLVPGVMVDGFCSDIGNISGIFHIFPHFSFHFFSLRFILIIFLDYFIPK